MYYAVLCTNWGDLNLYSKEECKGGEIWVNDKCVKNEALTDTSFWLKIVTQWITMSIYIFSLLAPLIFPGRDFE